MAKFNLTLEWLESAFDTYNKIYWKGKLIKPTFEICKTKNRLGEFLYKRVQGKNVYSAWKIRISNYFDRTETEYTNTLLHEMIHLYFRQNYIEDTSKHHGILFQHEAERINRCGWNISRTDSTHGCGLTHKSNTVYHLIAVKFKPCTYFVASVNEKYLYHIIAKLERNTSYIIEFFTFTSTDDTKFASYPKCRARLSGKYIQAQEYEEYRKLSDKMFEVWSAV